MIVQIVLQLTCTASMVSYDELSCVTNCPVGTIMNNNKTHCVKQCPKGFVALTYESIKSCQCYSGSQWYYSTPDQLECMQVINTCPSNSVMQQNLNRVWANLKYQCVCNNGYYISTITHECVSCNYISGYYCSQLGAIDCVFVSNNQCQVECNQYIENFVCVARCTWLVYDIQQGNKVCQEICEFPFGKISTSNHLHCIQCQHFLNVSTNWCQETCSFYSKQFNEFMYCDQNQQYTQCSSQQIISQTKNSCVAWGSVDCLKQYFMFELTSCVASCSPFSTFNTGSKQICACAQQNFVAMDQTTCYTIANTGNCANNMISSKKISNSNGYQQFVCMCEQGKFFNKSLKQCQVCTSIKGFFCEIPGNSNCLFVLKNQCIQWCDNFIQGFECIETCTNKIYEFSNFNKQCLSQCNLPYGYSGTLLNDNKLCQLCSIIDQQTQNCVQECVPPKLITQMTGYQQCSSCQKFIDVQTQKCIQSCDLPYAISNNQCGSCQQFGNNGLPLRSSQVCIDPCLAQNNSVCETVGNQECKFVSQNKCMSTCQFPLINHNQYYCEQCVEFGFQFVDVQLQQCTNSCSKSVYNYFCSDQCIQINQALFNNFTQCVNSCSYYAINKTFCDTPGSLTCPVVQDTSCLESCGGLQSIQNNICTVNTAVAAGLVVGATFIVVVIFFVSFLIIKKRKILKIKSKPQNQALKMNKYTVPEKKIQIQKHPHANQPKPLRKGYQTQRRFIDI